MVYIAEEAPCFHLEPHASDYQCTAFCSVRSPRGSVLGFLTCQMYPLFSTSICANVCYGREQQVEKGRTGKIEKSE